MGVMLTFGSLFSGVGGFDLGLERAGWKCEWQVEIDKYRRGVLAKHWPEVRRYEDVREFGDSGHDHGPERGEGRPRRNGSDAGADVDSKQGRNAWGVDLICGGFPCQDLSVAGQRAGLSGSRSGLWWEFDRIIGEVRPTWICIENVPGLLNSNGGDDFALILSALGERGYGYAYRILDSRYFGVFQRRRRVYIVGHSSGRCDYPASVLFEPEGGGGDTALGGTPGQDVAADVGDGVAKPLGRGLRSDLDNETYVTIGALDGTFGHHGLAHSAQLAMAGHYIPGLASGVRRLTPVECERLQAFPDNWTDGADGPRYAAMGDAVTVNVIQWIGERMRRCHEALT